MKRVNKLIRPSRPSRKSGNPLLPTTPRSIAIHGELLHFECDFPHGVLERLGPKGEFFRLPPGCTPPSGLFR
jgi:hypothetical protein